MNTEQIARQILRSNGVEDPHPALLADTVREVEYHNLTEAPSQEPVYEVVRDEYDVPCEHPACDVMHRHLYNSEYADGSRLIDLYNMQGEWIGQRRESRYHTRTVRQWIILRDGERVGDAHDTKREALAEAATRPTI